MLIKNQTLMEKLIGAIICVIPLAIGYKIYSDDKFDKSKADENKIDKIKVDENTIVAKENKFTNNISEFKVLEKYKEKTIKYLCDEGLWDSYSIWKSLIIRLINHKIKGKVLHKCFDDFFNLNIYDVSFCYFYNTCDHSHVKITISPLVHDEFDIFVKIYSYPNRRLLRTLNAKIISWNYTLVRIDTSDNLTPIILPYSTLQYEDVNIIQSVCRVNFSLVKKEIQLLTLLPQVLIDIILDLCESDYPEQEFYL